MGADPPPVMATDAELYKLARAQIEHENTLIGQRVSWFLTFQGLLFTAFFLLTTTLLDPNRKAMPDTARNACEAAVVVIGSVGALSALACFGLVHVANAQIGRVCGWWDGRGARGLPPLNGAGSRIPGSLFIGVLFIAWIILVRLFDGTP